MLIFNKAETEIKKIEETFNEFYCSDEYIDDTLIEMSRALYQFESGLLIADLKAEVAVIEGVNTAEVIMEAVGGEFFAKAKKTVVDFFNRIVEIIKNFMAWIKQQFTFGEKFAKEYGPAILAKKVTGFKFKGYNYDPGNGWKVGREIISVLSLNSGNNVEKVLAASKSTIEKGEDKSDRSKDLFDALKYGENTAEVIKNVKLAYQGKDADKGEKDYTFEEVTCGKEDMLKFIENANTTIQAIEQNETVAKKTYNDLIKAVDALKSEYNNSENKEVQIANVNKLVGYYKVEASLLLNICAAEFKMVKEMNSHFVTTLKKYLSYKPAAEVKTEKTAESMGIFEQAMNLV